MSKPIVLAGATLILISIILGAMAAHAMEKVISTEVMETFETGVKYQFYTGIALLTVGLNLSRITFNIKPFVILNLLGVLLFSGGIYLYSFHEIVAPLRSFVRVVPFGGTAFIAAWLVFIIQLIRQK